MGREHEGNGFAKANIDAWTAEIEGAGLDAIIITASGCGTTIKDYGHMLRNDAGLCRRRRPGCRRWPGTSRNSSPGSICRSPRPKGLTVAYHSACSMQHGQKITDAPKHLLRRMGFTVKDVPEAHICCGSAGVYNILQPEIAGQLGARKVQEHRAHPKPDLIATGNIGCMTQIGRGTEIPIVHTVQLIDWALGGPRPDSLPTLT